MTAPRLNLIVKAVQIPPDGDLNLFGDYTHLLMVAARKQVSPEPENSPKPTPLEDNPTTYIMVGPGLAVAIKPSVEFLANALFVDCEMLRSE